MKNGRKHTSSASGVTMEAESGANGDQQRPSKRVKLEQDIDADLQLLHPTPGPSVVGRESVTPPAAVLGQRGLPGRPNKRKRGWPRKNCEQREQELLNDPRTSAVEPGQVLCRMCGHWIQLCRQSDFAMQNWNSHSSRCQERTGWLAKVKREPESAFELTVADVPPPQTIEEAPKIKEEGGAVPIRGRRGLSNEDRRQILEQDRRLKKVDPHQVVCMLCDRVVKLHRTRPYELWNWTQHARKCASKRMTRVGEPSSGVTTDDATAVDDATVESDTEVEAALVARDDPSPPALATSLGSAFPSTIAPPPVPTDRPNTALETEWDDARAASSSLPIPTMTPTSVKRELSDYAPLVLPYGSDLLPNPPPLLSPAPAPAVSISAPLPKKPTPPVKAARHNKKGRNEEERKKALESDPRCSEVRPHEVFCLLCKRWIKLYREVSYIDSNWLRHAERCELRHGAAPRKKPRLSSPSADVKLVSAVNEDAPAEEGTAESSQASAKRLRELQNDSRLTKVEAHQVLCGVCKQWVKLQPYRDYDTWNWRKHILTCEQRNRQGAAVAPVMPDDVGSSSMPAPDKQAPSVVPTGAESVEERKAILESDTRCTHVEPHRVLCLLCNRHIGLHMKKDYSLVNWFRHIESCTLKKGGSSNFTQSAPVIPRRKVRLRLVNESISAAPKRARPVDDDDDDDLVEISRNEAEVGIANIGNTGFDKRKEVLFGDPRISIVKPDRVLCKICNQWLKLNSQHPYTPSNWLKHIGRCERKRARDGAAVSVSAVAGGAAAGAVKEQSPELVLLDGPSMPVTAPPALAPARGKGRTADERRELMRADERIRALEPYKAQCGLCDRWIRLHNKLEYEPYNWYTHINKCALKPRPEEQAKSAPDLVSDKEMAHTPNSPALQSVGRKGPADRPPLLNAEGRREVLLLDGRAAAVEPHRVLCALCSQWIKLKEDKAFVGHNFFKHVERCARRNQALSIAAQSRTAVAPTTTDVVIKTEEEPGLTGGGGGGLLKPKDEMRQAALLADPRQGGVEPGRVFCKMCRNWIKLNTSAGFLAGNWRRHAARCQKSSKWQGAALGGEDIPLEHKAVEIIDLELDDEEGPIDSSLFGFIELGRLVNAFEPSVSSTEFAIRQPDPPKEQKKGPPMPLPVPVQAVRNLRARMSSASLTPKPEEPVASPNKRPHRSEASRKDELERDPRVRIVHPEKILCAMCDKWIQMRRDISYSNQNWLKHAVSCQNRTGWSRKMEEPSKTPDKEEQEREQDEARMEEILPFNARNRIATDEVEHVTNISSFKPVDWQQEVVASDGEDEDDYYPISPGVFVPEPEPVPNERPLQREVMGVSVMVKQEHPEVVVDLTVSPEKEKTTSAVPTPLSSLHLKKPANGEQDLDNNNGVLPSLPSSLSQPQPAGAANPGPGPKKARKSTSKSPPTPVFSNPFTTAPLSRQFSNMMPIAPGSMPGPLSVAGQSIAEFVAAIHAEKNAGASASGHAQTSTAVASSAPQKRDSPFAEVLTLTPLPFSLTTMPSPSFGSYPSTAHSYGRMLVPPMAHSSSNSGNSSNGPSPVPAERPPYMYGGIPVGGPSPFNMKQPPPNPAYYMRPPRPNGYPTPISAVMGQRMTPTMPTIPVATASAAAAAARSTADDFRAAPPPSATAAAVQLTPYAPGPTPTPTPAPPPMQSPLTAIMRDRPPMLYLMPAHLSIPDRTPPPLPSPLSETSADSRRSASAN